ncbi:MAG TPA: SDR family oxidoreductase [Blastocatellia bacterium]|nr:SDR family oxidoreductase [Blastocatellia bacterium]
MKLKDRVVLITGGNRGIGRTAALALAVEGADLVLLGLDEEGLHRVADEVRTGGRRCLTYRADVSREEDVQRAVEQALDHFGRIDVLVNNAAIMGPTAPVVNVALAEWQETLAVNLTGPFLCCRAVLPQMIARRSGKIINISSIGGRRAYPLRAPYAVSKAGLLMLTRTLAAEVGEYNIQVNAICPGPVAGERMRHVIEMRARQTGLSIEETTRQFVERTALRRMVEERDVAALILFLASDDGNNITGAIFDVTAGYGL